LSLLIAIIILGSIVIKYFRDLQGIYKIYLTSHIINVLLYFLFFISIYNNMGLFIENLLVVPKIGFINVILNLIIFDFMFIVILYIIYTRYMSLFRNDQGHNYLKRKNAIILWIIFGLFGVERLYLREKRWITVFHLISIVIFLSLLYANIFYGSIYSKIVNNYLITAIYLGIFASSIYLSFYSLWDILRNYQNSIR
jgi:hypothetical protein